MKGTPGTQQIKQGALVGGCICLGLGLVIMYFSLWLFIIYGPLLLVAFILGIAALAQGRTLGGVTLLLVTLTLPLVVWLTLGMSRTGAALKKAGNYIDAESRKRGFVPIQVSPNGEFYLDKRSTPIPAIASTRLSVLEGPAAISADQASIIGKSFSENIANADASRIVIVTSRDFGPCRNIASTSANINLLDRPPRGPSYPNTCPWLSFSPDGRSVLYGAQYNGQSHLIARNLLTGELLQDLVLNSDSSDIAALAWSNDGKRAIFCDMRPSFTVVEFETKRQINLPPIAVPDRMQRMLWQTSGEVLLVMAQGIDALDLNALSISEKEHFKVYNPDFNINRVMAGALPPAQTYMQIQGTLVVQDPISPTRFTTLLMPNFHGNFIVSPDYHCILISENERMRVYYLGLRNPPRRNYWAELDVAKLEPARYKAWKSFLQEGGVFVGDVCAARTNPLNGRSVGPDTETVKGQVTISRWHEHFVDLSTERELSAFQPGDIVTNVQSYRDHPAENYFSDLDRYWMTLQFDSPPMDSVSQTPVLADPAQETPVSVSAISSLSTHPQADQSWRNGSGLQFAPGPGIGVNNSSAEDVGEAALRAAEMRLNAVYQQTRQRLSVAQRARLKSEEIRWIKQKDGVPVENAARQVFIERRIQELLNWR